MIITAVDFQHQCTEQLSAPLHLHIVYTYHRQMPESRCCLDLLYLPCCPWGLGFPERPGARSTVKKSAVPLFNEIVFNGKSPMGGFLRFLYNCRRRGGYRQGFCQSGKLIGALDGIVIAAHDDAQRGRVTFRTCFFASIICSSQSLVVPNAVIICKVRITVT